MSAWLRKTQFPPTVAPPVAYGTNKAEGTATVLAILRPDEPVVGAVPGCCPGFPRSPPEAPPPAPELESRQILTVTHHMPLPSLISVMESKKESVLLKDVLGPSPILFVPAAIIVTLAEPAVGPPTLIKINCWPTVVAAGSVTEAPSARK
jgi:hypothetical protein